MQKRNKNTTREAPSLLAFQHFLKQKCNTKEEKRRKKDEKEKSSKREKEEIKEVTKEVKIRIKNNPL